MREKTATEVLPRMRSTREDHMPLRAPRLPTKAQDAGVECETSDDEHGISGSSLQRSGCLNVLGASAGVRGGSRPLDFPEHAIVVVGQELPRLVRLVESFRVAGDPVEQMMDGPAKPQAETHPSDADNGVQRASALVQIAGEIGCGPHQCRRFRQLPAPPCKMGDLDIATDDHTPAGFTDLYAIVEVVTGTELPPGKGIGNLPPHHQASPAGPVAILESNNVFGAEDPWEEIVRQAIE